MPDQELDDRSEQEAVISFTAMTLFYGFILFFLAQILVLAAAGLSALAISFFTNVDFQKYFGWMQLPYEGIAIWIIFRILKRSFSGKQIFLDSLKPQDDGLGDEHVHTPFLLNEKNLAVIVLVTGLLSVAWIYLMKYVEESTNWRYSGLIALTIILTFGAIFMSCFLAARIWVARALRFDSVAGLATLIFGIWIAVSKL